MNEDELIKKVNDELSLDDVKELIRWAWKEAKLEQRNLCIAAINNCEDTGFGRIRRLEALGACVISAE